MISELRTLLKLLGPRNLIRNARMMKRAREPVRGYVTTLVFWALMKVGFIDELLAKQRVSPDDFCRDHDLDPDIMNLLCTYLLRVGCLSQSNQTCSFTKRGLRFWQDTNGVLNIFSAYQPFFQEIEQFLRKQVSLDSRQRIDERVAMGFRETGANFTFAGMTKLLQQMQCESMIELGCGNIDLSLFACHEMPALRCLGIDREPTVLEQARTTIKEQGLNDRVDLLEADLFEISSAAHDFTRYDVVTAIDLFHGYFHEGRDRLLQLLKRLREAFAENRFVVSEMCLADDDRMSQIAYPMVEHELFHGLTRQKTFAAGELEDMLVEAGFRIVEEWPARNLAARIFLVFE